MSDRLFVSDFIVLCDRFICHRIVRAGIECPTWGCLDSVLLFCAGWGKEEEVFTLVQSSEKVLIKLGESTGSKKFDKMRLHSLVKFKWYIT